MSQDSFSEFVNSMNSFQDTQGTDLAPSFPAISNSSGNVLQNRDKYYFKVKYGKWPIDEEGNEELEAIMDDCAVGKKILCWERMTTTKDGDTFITLKYIDPILKQQVEIPGQRRQRKARVTPTPDAI